VWRRAAVRRTPPGLVLIPHRHGTHRRDLLHPGWIAIYKASSRSRSWSSSPGAALRVGAFTGWAWIWPRPCPAPAAVLSLAMTQPSDPLHRRAPTTTRRGRPGAHVSERCRLRSAYRGSLAGLHGLRGAQHYGAPISSGSRGELLRRRRSVRNVGVQQSGVLTREGIIVPSTPIQGSCACRDGRSAAPRAGAHPTQLVAEHQMADALRVGIPALTIAAQARGKLCPTGTRSATPTTRWTLRRWARLTSSRRVPGRGGRPTRRRCSCRPILGSVACQRTFDTNP